VLARVRTHVVLSRARSALTQSYQRLRALEELCDNLVHTIVHDMKSPLMAVLVHLKVLEGPVAALAEDSQEDLRPAIMRSRHERSYHSAGLGLTFCKLAVEAHAGPSAWIPVRPPAARSGSSCRRDGSAWHTSGLREQLQRMVVEHGGG
jgi:K+-sensing histidine kinase KdpD